ncbi:MAG: PspC domain-containing protein [Bacteroidales bacterium]|nr:PspC domain-containing protein [Bacteroidales bacterium]
MGTKRLTRSYKGVIGGVCGGLGKYFEIDPVLVRAIFLLLFFMGGGGLLAYIILWIVMPRNTDYFAHYQTENPDVEQENTQTTTTETASRSNMAAYILGLSLIAFGVIILLRKLFLIGFSYLLPIGLIAVGTALILAYLFNHKKTES